MYVLIHAEPMNRIFFRVLIQKSEMLEKGLHKHQDHQKYYQFLFFVKQKLQVKIIVHTLPSLLKHFSRSLLVTRVDKPVTYKLFPGFLASLESWLLLHVCRIHTISKEKKTEFMKNSSCVDSLTHYIICVIINMFLD